jgi:hypothetical protein
MRQCKWIGLIAVGVMLASGSAQAAPVSRPVAATLSLAIQGLAPITFSSSSSISVDEATSQLLYPAGMIQLATTIVVPVTASTAIAQLKASSLSNVSGTFSPGGALSQASGETCPPAGGEACVVGGGIGGVMALTGTILVSVIPGVVVIPVNVNAAGVGQGGATTSPFTFDAAPWTTKTGQVNTGANIVNLTGTVSTTGSQFSTVTPTFVLALGNQLPLFVNLTVAFTDAGGLPSFLGMPEPTALLAVGSVLGALALLSRRRRD